MSVARTGPTIHCRGQPFRVPIPCLRLPDEADEEFRRRAERAAAVAKLLVDACLRNICMQGYLADSALPYSVEGVRASPTVRVEFEQAIAIGGIGETLEATRHKHWGAGPWIMPLEPEDWFFPDRITYVYRENSLYNRRFEQRMRLKELLGHRHRKLVGEAKWHTQAIFLQHLTAEQARAIRQRLNVSPKEFWRAARGKVFLPLPPRLVQLELPLGDLS